MKKFYFLIIIGLILIAEPVFARTYWLNNPLKNLVGSEPLTVGVATFIGSIIQILMGFLGAAALLLFVYGGFILLSSTGNTEKISQGKRILIWATIGLVLVLFSYAIIDFTIFALTGQRVPANTGNPPPTPPPTSICDDGIDNDGDGKIDHAGGPGGEPADPGCAGNPAGTSETDPVKPECSDGIDNDGDSYCDTAGATCTDGSTPNDVGCTGPDDDREKNPQCSDGLDNDSDGKIDFGSDPVNNDPGCINANDDDESNDPPLPPPALTECEKWSADGGPSALECRDIGCDPNDDDCSKAYGCAHIPTLCLYEHISTGVTLCPDGQWCCDINGDPAGNQCR